MGLGLFRHKGPTEEVPTFLVSKDRIVEVMFTTWTETAPGAWRVTAPSQDVTLPEDIDRIVFELPIGCYETRLFAPVGSHIDFQPGGGDSGFRTTACHRPAHFEESSVPAELTVPGTPGTEAPLLR